MTETSGFSLCFSKYFRDPGYQERIVEENLFVKMYGLGVPACLPKYPTMATSNSMALTYELDRHLQYTTGKQ